MSTDLHEQWFNTSVPEMNSCRSETSDHTNVRSAALAGSNSATKDNDGVSTSTDRVDSVEAEASSPMEGCAKKTMPGRIMSLTGLPPPTLPPRPIFPPELESYQAHVHNGENSSLYTSQMELYLSSIRTDYEKQLRCHDHLKGMIEQDPFYTTKVVQELDAMDEDPFTLDSFENLMRMHANKGKDFILARVTTQDPNDETKLYHSHYGAHQINKVLFRTQPEEGLLHRMKARNPLNNMLVVGDVHYYIISADDVNAVKSLPATKASSTASISSHSSRMSRCSKLAAQAIASQSASARSSPIMSSDMSLFSRTSDVESPVSIISPMMVMEIMKADRESAAQTSTTSSQHSEQRIQRSPSLDEGDGPSMDPSEPTHLLPQRRGSSSSCASIRSTMSTSSQSGFQPTRPSRLRQSIDPEGNSLQGAGLPSNRTEDMMQPSCPLSVGQEPTLAGYSDPRSPIQSPAVSPSTWNHSRSPSPQPQAQSPLFQSLMTLKGGMTRSRNNTISSVDSRGSMTSSIQSSSTASDLSDNSYLSTSSSRMDEKLADLNDLEPAVYKFKYLASDDDFLLRSTVRQVFKANALEAWDAILFTISNNALREYSTNPPTSQPPAPPMQQPSSPEVVGLVDQPEIVPPQGNGDLDNLILDRVTLEQGQEDPAGLDATVGNDVPNDSSSERSGRTGFSQSLPSLTSVVFPLASSASFSLMSGSSPSLHDSMNSPSSLPSIHSAAGVGASGSGGGRRSLLGIGIGGSQEDIREGNGNNRSRRWQSLPQREKEGQGLSGSKKIQQQLPTPPNVLIVGAGLAGLMLGLLLEKAQIPYTILERARAIKPLGSVMSLNVNILPALQQAQLMDDLLKISFKNSGMQIYTEDLEQIADMTIDGYREKIGYDYLVFSRPELYSLFLSRIPPEKIRMGKKILNVVDTPDAVNVHCSDGSSYSGDILVGADGAYSSVRQRLYQDLAAKGQLPAEDDKELNKAYITMVGTTEELDPEKFPALKDQFSHFSIMIGKGSPYTWSTFTVPNNRICWNVQVQLDKVSTEDEAFRSSEWGPESGEGLIKEISQFKTPHGTMGEIVGVTPRESISKVLLEDKLFQTWHGGRTVLIGDGAVNAMQDAVILANCLYDLEDTSVRSLTAAFKEYRDQRFHHVKYQFDVSQTMAKVLFGQTWLDRTIRTVMLNYIPKSLMMRDAIKGAAYRPQVMFLPMADNPGQGSVLPQKPSKRYQREQAELIAAV
ncbi:hypothetical protein BGW38_007208 [Lunasporangiospora selenospora]|uniref:FAD-binding domain-containing protein n=1 Tax=Lunasporangiospora selenospora TaxID=979761 RepID=A0A9P6KGX6_9FUNG|nr:hypothetical protein BGW38_007208 [Lunasporangiospora selenospora]